ncbi:MAG: hypothetical protein EAZ53_07740 [Bacteroidetes bacterium]|nr:MAG: hypothetical protein EAZ53_07740 [Bacteroidota bacterium]
MGGIFLYVIFTDVLSNFREYSILQLVVLLSQYILLIFYGIDYIFTEIEIDDNGVSKKELFRNTYLSYNEIKHFEKRKNGIFIFSKNENDKAIFIAKQLYKFKGIGQLLSLKIIEAPEIESAKKDKQYLIDAAINNHHFGDTVKTRLFVMNLFKYGNYILWGASIMLLIWLAFSTVETELTFSILISLPIFSYILLKFFNNYFDFMNINGAEKLDVSSMILVPSFGLFICSFSSFRLFESNLVLTISILLSLAVVLSLFDIFIKLKKVSYFVLIMTLTIPLASFSIYFYKTIKIVNIYFDNSTAKSFKVKILDKYIQKGKSKTHCIVIEKWYKRSSEESEDVSDEYYDKVKVGDSITIELYNGSLNTAYYVLKNEN